MAPIEDGGESAGKFGAEPDAGLDSPGNDLIRSTRYRMSTELAALDSDFLVLSDSGEHVFRFSSRALSYGDTIRIEDMQGQVLCEAPAHLARKESRVVIVDSAGVEIGSVVRQPLSPLRDRFSLETRQGAVFAVDGNVPIHEFSIVGPDGKIATVSRKWFRARGSYGIEISSGQQDAFLLTTAAVLDQMILGSV